MREKSTLKLCRGQEAKRDAVINQKTGKPGIVISYKQGQVQIKM